MRKDRIIYTSLVVIIDIAAILTGFYLAYLWRSNGRELFLWPWSKYWSFSLPFVFMYPIVFALLGVYPPATNVKEIKKIPTLIFASLGVWALYVVWLFFFRNEATTSMSRLMVIYILVATSSLVLIGRIVAWLVYKLLAQYRLGVSNLYLITHQTRQAQLAEYDLTHAGNIYNIAGTSTHIDIERIANAHSRQPLDEIIILNPQFPESEIFKVIRFAIPRSIAVKLVPKTISNLTTSIDDTTLPAMPLVEFRPTPLFGWGKFIKRLIDILFSLIAITLLSPIYLVISLMIKIESRGPVFYLHPRRGFNGQSINVIKFRTMKIEYCRGKHYGGNQAEKEFQKLMKNKKYRKEFQKSFKLQNDPRVTRMGHFLRHTSLDELPQFFNVLLGSLSLAGPRPIIDDEVERYKGAEFLLWSVKPGLSGLWQVSGRSDLSYDERVRLDLYYIDNWSVWLDLRIAVKTIGRILSRRGAY